MTRFEFLYLVDSTKDKTSLVAHLSLAVSWKTQLKIFSKFIRNKFTRFMGIEDVFNLFYKISNRYINTETGFLEKNVFQYS